MQSKLLQDGDTKTWAVVFDKDEEFISGLKQFAIDNQLDSTFFTAVGGFSDAVLAFFSREKMDYLSIPVSEQGEVLSLSGNITLTSDDRKVHAHAVLGLKDGSTRGGHVKEAHVWPTLEVVVEETPRHLKRTVDDQTGLTLINLGAR